MCRCGLPLARPETPSFSPAATCARGSPPSCWMRSSPERCAYQTWVMRRSAKAMGSSSSMRMVFAVSRGLGFMTPAVGADWHYAGAGVRLHQPERAVLWYKPAGTTTYRVIHADLSVTADVPAGALPKVEAKAIAPGPSPFPPARNAPPQPPPGTDGSE